MSMRRVSSTALNCSASVEREAEPRFATTSSTAPRCMITRRMPVCARKGAASSRTASITSLRVESRSQRPGSENTAFSSAIRFITRSWMV